MFSPPRTAVLHVPLAIVQIAIIGTRRLVASHSCRSRERSRVVAVYAAQLADRPWGRGDSGSTHLCNRWNRKPFIRDTIRRTLFHKEFVGAPTASAKGCLS